MQLTDDEIREILIKQKKKKRRQQRMRRRVTLLVVIVLIIAAAAAAVIHFGGAAVERSAKGIIFLDPGHGGSDPGSESGGRAEKDDTLQLAQSVKKALNRSGYRVIMSRTDDDETVDSKRRGEMANECGAQLMISLHRDAAGIDGNGVEVFIPTDSSRESQLLGMNIFDALISCGFAERSISTGTLESDKKDYEELAAAQIPCCLVEVGAVDSDADNKLFDDKLRQNSKAIAAAINDTFTELYAAEEAQKEETQ